MRRRWVFIGISLLIAFTALAFVSVFTVGAQETTEPPPAATEAPPPEEPPVATDPDTSTESDGDGNDVPWPAILIIGGIVIALLLLAGMWMGRRSENST